MDMIWPLAGKCKTVCVTEGRHILRRWGDVPWRGRPVP
jgi:hypothetical protein